MSVALCITENPFGMILALILEIYVIYQLIMLWKSDLSIMFSSAIVSAMFIIPMAIISFYKPKLFVSACIMFIFISITLFINYFRSKNNEYGAMVSSVKWYKSLVSLIIIPAVAGSLVFADGIRAIIQYNIPVLQLISPNIHGYEYYESGDYMKYRFGEAVSERFPRNDKLMGALNVDFAHNDYTLMETYFTDTNVQYFLSIEYPLELYNQEKTLLSTSVTQAEQNGNFEIYLLEKSKIGKTSYLYYFACCNSKRSRIVYLAIIDDNSDKECFLDFDTIRGRISGTDLWCQWNK